MCGKKGQPHPVRVRTCRQQMWQTMRIKAGRGFTIPDLMVTVPGATKSNVQKFVIKLKRHGIIKETGPSGSGRPGVYQAYRLAHNSGPMPPDVCPTCGRRLADEHREDRDGSRDK